MNREALTQLRRVVLDAPDDLWDMSTFGECGTAHCAAGWAAHDPWFQEHLPIGNSEWGWNSIAAGFGLSYDDASALFALELPAGLSRPVEKEAVIANIDRLLAGHAAEPYAGS